MRVRLLPLYGALALLLAAAAPAATRTVVVPIVLTSVGVNGSFFTTELAFTNRGTTDATATLAYTAAFGGTSGGAQEVLPAGS